MYVIHCFFSKTDDKWYYTIMLKNVLKIEGVTVLKREAKLVVKGQSCFDDAWDYGTRWNNITGGSAYKAMDDFYAANCM